MANRTDPSAKAIHGTNPQNLVEKIVRSRIYSNLYWKEHCFGLTAEGLVDKAMALTDYGGTYGGNKKPTKFLCLLLKMLQIQPERDIIIEFIKNEDYKYVRLLGAFYLRLTGKAAEVYEYLEPLYNDFRRIRKRVDVGHEILHVDEFIDQLLTQEFVCDITLPHLQKRAVLEQTDVLKPRISILELELEEAERAEQEERERQQQQRQQDNRTRERWRPSSSSSSAPAVSSASTDERDRDRDRDRERDRDRSDSGRDRDRDRDKDRERYSRDDRDRDRDRRDRDRDRDRDRGRDRDRDRDREGNRGSERKRDRDDRPRDDRDAKRNKDEAGGDTMSIEETNKMRAELGLKPLKK